MYCGFLKQSCNEISVEDFIKILEPYRNAKLKVQNNDSFYIHFDQSGDFININSLSLDRAYGAQSSKCKSCKRYNKEENKCGCDGSSCVTIDSFRSNDDDYDDTIETVQVDESVDIENHEDTTINDMENSIYSLKQEVSTLNNILKKIKQDLPTTEKKTVISDEDITVIIMPNNK